jgi:hypothetical protein
LQLIYHFGWQLYDLRYNPYDELILDFKLDAEMAASIPDYVWAVLAKDEFASIKDKRWDLVSLVPYSQFILNSHTTDVYSYR